MDIHELRHEYTDFVVNHHQALIRLGFAAIGAALPVAVAAEVMFETHSGPLLGFISLGVGSISISLAAAGSELERASDPGQTE